MSSQAIRAVVLAVNLGLISLVAWSSYLTFFHLDPTKWELDPPKLGRFEPPALGEDPLGSNREVYYTIFKVFEVKEPELEVKKEKTEAPPPVATPRGDVKGLKVYLLMIAAHEDAKSTVILAPARNPSAQRAFSEGMALDVFPEFSGYGGVVISEITEEEIVFSKDGKEHGRIPAKLTSDRGGR